MLTVLNTEEPDQLFRKGSFVTQLMFRQFSDKDAGLKYLKSTVLPLVAEISEMSPNELEVRFTVSTHQLTAYLLIWK